MRLAFWLIAATTLADTLNGAPPAAEVHVAFTVLQANALGMLKASQLAKTSQPKAGERLQVRLAATAACHGIVVGFGAAGSIAWPDQPAAIALQPGDQKALPAAGWKWEDAESVQEMDVLLVDDKSPALPALLRLVEAMQGSAAPAVRVRQVAELRRTIDSLTQRDTAAAEYSLKTDPVPLGGILRGDTCDWCAGAVKISLPDGGSWLVRQRFPAGGAR